MAVLVAALVAGGVAAAEASIPPPESWPSLVEEPAASVLQPPSLEDLAVELAAPAMPPAPDAAAAAGERFRLFEGLELGLAWRSEPRFRLYPRLETRVRAITLPEPVHIELELPLTPGRFRLYGDPAPRIAVGGTFTSVDPMGYVDSPSLYSFARNNPVNFTDPMGTIVVLVGNKLKALLDLRRGVPSEDAKFIRTKEAGGKTIVDPEVIRSRRSQSPNFKALQFLATQPVEVEVDTSVTEAQYLQDGTLITEQLGELEPGIYSYGMSLMPGIQSPKSGVAQVFIYGQGEALDTAASLAHELRHVALFLRGKPYAHEVRAVEITSEEGFAMRIEYDPQGPVNKVTGEAEEEVRVRGIDPFISPF